ncbi:hypothetical protein [Brevundimonas sp.]|uniref:hypothetical protein n=1 Tax=Brevundimonas sp. TaxID=1871086 RepID=UPI002D287413|nr:hypothetical protein [Brevundimonas sp.]HYD29181.1 hypothetical protein [Brevundimonas sp.]
MAPLLMGALAALSELPDLFATGKAIYEGVTGAPPAATSPVALAAEVQALPPDQADAWARRFEAEVTLYRAQTERLTLEQGEVSAAVLGALPPAVAGEVARLRMTTRPVIVRRMSHLLLVPLYLIVIDGAAMCVNALLAAFGLTTRIEPIAGQMFAGGSIYATLYAEATGPAAAVVVTYILAREAGKVAGGEGKLGAAVESAVGAVGRLGGLFRRGK